MKNKIIIILVFIFFMCFFAWKLPKLFPSVGICGQSMVYILVPGVIISSYFMNLSYIVQTGNWDIFFFLFSFFFYTVILFIVLGIVKIIGKIRFLLIKKY
jgi:hypothetical protein